MIHLAGLIVSFLVVVTTGLVALVLLAFLIVFMCRKPVAFILIGIPAVVAWAELTVPASIGPAAQDAQSLPPPPVVYVYALLPPYVPGMIARLPVAVYAKRAECEAAAKASTNHDACYRQERSP